MSAASKDKSLGPKIEFKGAGMADTAYSLFSFMADPMAASKYDLKDQLKKANMNLTPEQYVALYIMAMVVTSILALPMAFFMVPILFGGLFGLSGTLLQLVQLLMSLLPLYTYLYFWKLGSPASKAKQRGKTVNLYIPYAATYIASLAAANATLPVIFKSLAEQKEPKTGFSLKMAKAFDGDEEKEIYPEICKEAGQVYKDITLLGIDSVTALKNAVERAPSAKLAEFFQGIFSTITSGGSLKKYFLNSAEHYMEDNKQQQKEDLDFIALMAETYVVVGIAMPIFLLIILIITQWISKGGGEMDASMLYLIIFVLLPTIHLSFAAILYSSTKEI